MRAEKTFNADTFSQSFLHISISLYLCKVTKLLLNLRIFKYQQFQIIKIAITIAMMSMVTPKK